MKQRIKEIIKELKEVCKEEGLVISHDNLFSESISCYRGEQVGQNKKQYKETPKELPQEPATKKQLDFIYRNNLNIDTKDLTKKEGIKIIKEFKERNDKTKN